MAPDGFDPQIARMGKAYHDLKPIETEITRLRDRVKSLANEAEAAAQALGSFSYWETGMEDPMQGAREVGQVQYHLEEAAKAVGNAISGLRSYGVRPQTRRA